MSWYSYSFIAVIFIAVSFLLVKKASTAGISVLIFTWYIWALSTFLLFFYLLYYKESFTVSYSQFGIIVFATLVSMLGALILNKAVYLAPNPGYAVAIGSTQVILVTIASFFLFGSQITLLKFLGVLLIVGGVALLGI